jgi:phosphate transport system permease protein
MAGVGVFGLTKEAIERRDSIRRAKGRLHGLLLRLAALIVFACAAGIIGTIVWKGAPAMTWEFLSTGPREGMKEGGIWPMIRGSLLLMVGTLILVLPIGVLGGIWMAFYASQRTFASAVRAAVTSLAGTPSVICALFGFAIFVLMFDLKTSLLAGWLTLAIMSIPVVALTTELSLKAVPDSFSEAADALGMSRWQAIRKVILPAARSGIMTGLVLAAGRAVGEAPPILLTAGIYYSTEKLALGWDTIRKPVANLPYHLAEGYRQGGVIPEKIIWGTCLTLMLFVLLLNLGAIVVRARSRARQRW